VALHLVSQQW